MANNKSEEQIKAEDHIIELWGLESTDKKKAISYIKRRVKKFTDDIFIEVKSSGLRSIIDGKLYPNLDSYYTSINMFMIMETNYLSSYV